MRFLLLNSRDIIVILKQHPLQKVMVDLLEELSLPEESKTCLFGKKLQPIQDMQSRFTF